MDKCYRPNVGIILLNATDKIFCGKRLVMPHFKDTRFLWQMPQGGMHDGEEPLQAALRELAEETGIHSVEVMDMYPEWVTYDFPADVRHTIFDGQFHGQRQRWFRMRFVGSESEINLNPAVDEDPEFEAWAWMAPDEVLAHTVPFRRHVYEEVFHYFKLV